MLQVENISFRIKSKHILQGVSFETYPGEFIAVLGANGAGKSTLIKLLSQEHKPFKGRILWKKRALRKTSAQQMASERAVLTQNIHMSHDFPVNEVVLMGRYPHFKNYPQTKDLEAVKATMQQTDTLVFRDRSYASLSGGEKQRVQLARALAQLHEVDHHSSKLLLLDEPLNNLDVKHQHNCLRLSQSFAQQGNVLLMVMHDINLAAMYAHKILLLHQGQVVGFGTPTEVLTEDKLSLCYNFPVKVEHHPYHHCPAVYFGNFPKAVGIN
ncbi:MAG TPA: heme ABC transporter ATP-binding protein [Microscillaceae bacterium]|nr:heme ABC transporter ATP-binding protein [Microscillaceae bacterium]